MQKTSIVSLVGVILVVLITGFFIKYTYHPINDFESLPIAEVPVSELVATTTATHANIKSLSVGVNSVVTSPLTITGEARLWYFEGSFPVELVDGTGKRLAIAPAQAQGEWMTTEFVPFTVTLTFEQPTTATGTLILIKDNPSGMPELDDELRIPVQF